MYELMMRWPSCLKQVFNETITSKWKKEALSEEDVDITEAMIDWCIAELQYKTKAFLKTGAVSVYNGDVVKSDTVISHELKEALKAAAAPLEQVPERAKDWHPYSNNMVLDLVHPSLFPLIYGRSRILPSDTVGLNDCIDRSGEGVVVPVPPESENGLEHRPVMSVWDLPAPTTPFSRQFQWLPCDVDISDPVQVKIKSYINNLYPKTHSALYSVVEEIISRAIPLWNMSLNPLKERNFKYNRIHYTRCVYNPDPESGPETDGPQQGKDEDEDEFLERRYEWYEATRVVVLPEPGPFELPVYNDNLVGEALEAMNAAAVDLRRDYGERGLQVIVKLANIHLTSENPVYEGGSWHVEGQLNEHVCASAIYYYDSENITTSKLSFRQQSEHEPDLTYPQNHHDWLEAVFGCENESSGVQDSGTVDTPEGRLLTWPNVLQHRVQPFELTDPGKPGHRKILALFLVDPNIRIISTANIPCQQRDWWSDVVQQGAILKVPVEVQDLIFENVEEFPIGLEEAKELRLQLMEERAVFVKHYEDAFHQHRFSLCEH
ncbi:hypothetical protein C0991_009702 [Blastosporella zonata]|nr:hypothetical protein C0991_009702 [Blastosporella zonata]